MKNRIFKIATLLLFVMAIWGCKHVSREGNIMQKNENDSINVVDDYVTYSIFGVEAGKDQYSVIKSLEGAGILKIDSISRDKGSFQSAIVEFAGVKFGLNRGFIFITSKQDKQTIDSLVSKISSYYGDPDIDDEGEPEYNIYHWNLYTSSADKPYIRIRPLRSEDGGLVMTWRWN